MNVRFPAQTVRATVVTLEFTYALAFRQYYLAEDVQLPLRNLPVKASAG